MYKDLKPYTLRDSNPESSVLEGDAMATLLRRQGTNLGTQYLVLSQVDRVNSANSFLIVGSAAG
jgi:hypothetical protein